MQQEARHAGTVLTVCLIITAMSLLLMNEDNEVVLRIGSSKWVIHSVCAFRRVVGMRCPACGLTRSFVSLGHFEIAEAWHYNKIGIFLYLLVLCQIPYQTIVLIGKRKPKHRWTSISSGAIYLAVAALLVGWVWDLAGGREITAGYARPKHEISQTVVGKPRPSMVRESEQIENQAGALTTMAEYPLQ